MQINYLFFELTFRNDCYQLVFFRRFFFVFVFCFYRMYRVLLNFTLAQYHKWSSPDWYLITSNKQTQVKSGSELDLTVHATVLLFNSFSTLCKCVTWHHLEHAHQSGLFNTFYYFNKKILYSQMFQETNRTLYWFFMKQRSTSSPSSEQLFVTFMMSFLD